MTHNTLSDPKSWKLQWKFASLTTNFLYIGNKYAPDPGFYIFLGLGTNSVCYRYKKHLEMLCFTVKPQIFSPGRYIFLYMPKSFWAATTVLRLLSQRDRTATRKGLALTGFPGNAKMPDPDGSLRNNCSWVLRRRDAYPGHCMRFVSRLAYDLEYLYHGKAGNLKPHNQHKRWGCGRFSPTIPHEEPKKSTFIQNDMTANA